MTALELASICLRILIGGSLFILFMAYCFYLWDEREAKRKRSEIKLTIVGEDDEN